MNFALEHILCPTKNETDTSKRHLEQNWHGRYHLKFVRMLHNAEKLACQVDINEKKYYSLDSFAATDIAARFVVATSNPAENPFVFQKSSMKTPMVWKTWKAINQVDFIKKALKFK